ncbi:S41 family peptidase [bacterium]|nr:S41 family peptidase [bacterium]
MALIKTPSRRYVAMAVVGLLLVGGASATSASKNIYAQIRTYNNVFANVFDQYVDEVDSEELVNASIRGMMSSLDPHSTFLEKKQYDDLLLETQGRYGGVGISIDVQDEWLTVVSPIEGGPAYDLGIQAGDRIIQIEGENTKGLTTAEAAKILRGRKGTQVTITIARKGEPEPFDIVIERDVIELKSVPYAGIIRDDIGYLRLSRFSEESGAEVDRALHSLLEQGAKGIIFDLRSNHGGLLTQAVSVSDKFLARGKLISYTQGRNPADRSEYYASENPIVPADVPVAILVNRSTASAAEIVSGAVQDDGRAVILGELTYGKGLVQTLIDVGSPDVSLKLTTAKWYTPAGRCIQKPFSDEEAGPLAVGSHDADDMSMETSGNGEVDGKDKRGGGIEPDVELDGDPLSRYGLELLNGNFVFKFSVDYTSKHPEITRDWRVSDDVLQEFAAFLKEKDFQYETVAQRELDRLEDLAEQEEFDASTRAAMDALAAQLESEKQKDFAKNRDYIEFAIEREIKRKLYGDAGSYEVSLRTDSQAQAAVDLLLDRDRYQDILAHKRPVVAVESSDG